MTDPERIIHGPDGALETALLRSVRREAPPAQARARTLALLGFSAGAVTGVTATAKATAAVLAVSAKSTTTATLAFTAKWVLVGVGAAALTVGVARELSPSVSVHSPAPSASVAAAQGISKAARRTSLSPPDTAMPTETSNSVAPVASILRAVDKGSVRNFADSNANEQSYKDSNLGAEVAALDNARAASVAQNPVRTLKLLDSYQRQFPNGTLAPEAQLLRIEALVQNGQSAIALPIARQMLNAAPTGPHAERIRALLPAADSTDPVTITKSNQADPATAQ